MSPDLSARITFDPDGRAPLTAEAKNCIMKLFSAIFLIVKLKSRVLAGRRCAGARPRRLPAATRPVDISGQDVARMLPNIAATPVVEAVQRTENKE
jgi:hypothetical protein